jgi:DNA-binding NarL/FixJ family response regulator
VITAVVGQIKSDDARRMTDALSDTPTQIRILGSGLRVDALERVVASRAPDVAIFDESVDHSLLVRVRSTRPLTGLIVLAYAPSLLFGTMLLGSGVSCVADGVVRAEMMAAVCAAVRGEPLFLSANGLRLERDYPENIGLLTRRERQVLAQLSCNKSDAEIGLALQIGVETVRTHVTRICRKLKRNRHELIGIRLPSDISRPLD